MWPWASRGDDRHLSHDVARRAVEMTVASAHGVDAAAPTLRAVAWTSVSLLDGRLACLRTSDQAIILENCSTVTLRGASYRRGGPERAPATDVSGSIVIARFDDSGELHDSCMRVGCHEVMPVCACVVDAGSLSMKCLVMITM